MPICNVMTLLLSKSNGPPGKCALGRVNGDWVSVIVAGSRMR
jgi:hypothetical protein